MSPKQQSILQEAENRIADSIRLRGYSYETLKAYRGWLRRYLVWWHCLDTTIQRAMAEACVKMKMPGAITPHHLRHAWATHAHRAGATIRDLAEVLGHSDIRTTMRYVSPDPEAVPSPFESVAAVLPKIIPFPKSA